MASLVTTILFAMMIASSVCAQTRLTPVAFSVAGHELPLTPSAVWTGTDTYVPLMALKAIGASGSLTPERDRVRIRLRNGRTDQIPYKTRKGIVMISIADLAETVDGVVIKPSPTPASGLRANTAYLLAHITDLRITGGAVRITTSFPVPFVSNNVVGTSVRGYVDCIGAVAGRGVAGARGGPRGTGVDRVRVALFAPDITRVALDMAPGYMLERANTEGRVTPTFAAAIETRNIRASRPEPYASRTPDGMPTETGRYRPAPPRERPVRPADQSDELRPSRPRSTGRVRGDTTMPIDRDSSRGADTGPDDTGAALIRSISYDPIDNQSIQIIVGTSRRVRPFVKINQSQVVIDFPNSTLRLRNPSQRDRDISHPLVAGYLAETVPASGRKPALTRITVDTSAEVVQRTDVRSNEVIIEISAGGIAGDNLTGHASARPGTGENLVVVDAGHGEGTPGARAVQGGRIVYEKDITLAIAIRLRRALQARGVRVVMTRTSNANVPLVDRPRIANQIGANVFISIHNDSWDTSNSISGTTTYYHGNQTESRRLAGCVERRIAAVSGLRDRGARSDVGRFPIGFCVLRDARMPAVLSEVGYLNNSNDSAKLTNPAYQQQIAEAMSEGIREYLGSAPSKRSVRRNERVRKKRASRELVRSERTGASATICA